MSECLWEKIDAFQSQGEFRRFEAWLAKQIQGGDAEQVEVKRRYAAATTPRERWFRHKSSGKTWRLVDPDPPFPGTFEPT
jgi:hypothetical protein